MHKRTLEFFRLLSPLLLTILLLVPIPVNAAVLTGGLMGPEQPEAPFEPSDIPSHSDIPEVGYIYTVVAGDDVWLIAIAHGISMETLTAANRLEPPYWIYPGDRLFVPAEPAVVKHPPPPAQKPEAPAKQPEPAPAAAPEPIAPTATVTTPTEIAPAAPEAANAAEPVAETSVAPVEISDEAALILNLINEKRAAYGLATLSWSPNLAQAARDHAVDCAQRGWGSHVGSDGARLRTRLSRAGYQAAWSSENWANSRNAQHAFEMWWYEGPGGPHYDNIMSWNFSEIGIGLAKGGWGYYAIADFGSQ